jgi:hypothetical protein
VTHLRKMMLEELQGRHYSEATTQRFFGGDAGIEGGDRRKVWGVAFEKAVQKEAAGAADAGLMQIEWNERGVEKSGGEVNASGGGKGGRVRRRVDARSALAVSGLSHRNTADLAGACSCGTFVVSRAGQAYDVRARDLSFTSDKRKNRVNPHSVQLANNECREIQPGH